MSGLRKDSIGAYKSGGEEAAVNVISDQISPSNEIDDIIVLHVTVDNARTVTTPTGFTQIAQTNDNAVTLAVYWRRATAVNEALPDVTISVADSVTVGYYVLRNCPTDSTPIGNVATRTSHTASPIWDPVNYSGYNTVLYLGSMDQDTMLSVGDLPSINPIDDLTSSSIAAYSFDAADGNTGTVTGAASAPDGWATMTLEILDDGTQQDEFRFGSPPLSAIGDTTEVTDNSWRDLLANSGEHFFDGTTISAVNFDAATDVDPVTDQITITGHPFSDGDELRIVDNGNTLPAGLTDGNYYFAAVVDANTITLRDANGQMQLDGDYFQNDGTPKATVDITAIGSGICTLERTGVLNVSMTVSGIFDKPPILHSTGQNWHCGGLAFGSPRDMSNDVFYSRIDSLTCKNTALVFIDSDGDYRVWEVSRTGYQTNDSAIQIDVANSIKFVNEYGTFDVTSVKYIVYAALRPSSNHRTGGLQWYFTDNANSGDINPVGCDSTEPATWSDIFRESQYYSTDTSSHAAGTPHYTFLQPIVIGGGHLATDNALCFNSTEQAVAFPAVADGITRFQHYVNTLGITIDINEASVIDITNNQLKADYFTVDPDRPAGATLAMSPITTSEAAATLSSYDTVTRGVFVGGTGITHNDATLDNCSFSNIARAAGYLVLSTTHNIISPTFVTDTPADYAIEIDTPGDYDISGFTFFGFTTVINVTAASGTVNIQLAYGQSTPTYVTAGATVAILQATLPASVASVTAGSRIQVYNVTTASETHNEIVAGSTWSDTYVDGTDYSVGDTIRVRLTYQSGVTAKKEWTANAIATTSGWSLIAAQEDDDVYIGYGLDGSTLASKFAADYVAGQIDVTVGADFYGAEAYAWWVYNLTTDEGIREFYGVVEAQDLANILIRSSRLSLMWDNTSAGNHYQLDNVRWYREDGAYPVEDPTSGGGGLDVVWRDRVYLVNNAYLDAPVSSRSTFDPASETVTTDEESRLAARARVTIAI